MEWRRWEPVHIGNGGPGAAEFQGRELNAGTSSGLVAAGLLRELQMSLRFLDQHRRFVLRARNRRADADAHADIPQHARARVMDAQFAHALCHRLSHLHRLLVREPGCECHQAAAVDARRDVARASQASRDAMRHAPNGGVASGAAKCRVVQIQRIDVDGEHRNAAALALRYRPISFQQLLEIRQREQARQAVVAHRNRRRLLGAVHRIPRELGIDAQPLARVAMVSRKMRDSALRIAQRHYRHLVPEDRPILPVIAQQDAARFAFGECVAKPVSSVLFAVVGLQQSEVLADEIGARIAGQRLEAGIHVHDRMLRTLRVHEHNSLGGAFEQAPIEIHVEALHDWPSVKTSGGADVRFTMRCTVSSQCGSAVNPAGTSPRARIRTNRACDAGDAPSGLKLSSTAVTAARSLQIGSTSHPAASPSRARSTTSPNATAPAIERSSAKTQPWKPNSPRRISVIQRLDRLAGKSSMTGYTTWAAMIPGTLFSMSIRYGRRSSPRSTKSRRSTGSATCESATTAP